MSPRVETYSLCCLPIELPSFFLHVPFQHHSPQFILAKCPIRLLKILHGKLELSTTMNNIIISKPRGPYLPLSLG